VEQQHDGNQRADYHNGNHLAFFRPVNAKITTGSETNFNIARVSDLSNDSLSTLIRVSF